jgi:type I restriction enzyme S subunit
MLAEIPFCDIAEINPPRRKLDFDARTEVSFVPMSDVSESGRWITRSSRPLCEVSRGYTYFKEGDVLFAKITPCTENGKGFHAKGLENGLGFASTEFHVLRAKENAAPGFIYQWSIYRQLRLSAFAAMTGSAGQQRVPASFFSSFRVPQVAKPEQTKIAEILSTVDRVIEQTEALIDKQQLIKTGLMQDLLTRGIDEHGNLRSEQTHQFKDSPLGRIPVEWRVNSVVELSTKVTDGDHHTPKRSESGFYLLSARNVNDGYIDIRDVDFVPEDEYRRMLRRCNPEAGDILVSCSGTIGRVCEVPEWLECVLVRSAALIKFKREAITSRFAEWAMHSFIVQSQILAAQRQAAQPNLFQGEIEGLRLPKPPIDEQKMICESLDSVQADINHCTTSMKKLRLLKTALMQDLLTGEVRVTPLLNEPQEAGA